MKNIQILFALTAILLVSSFGIANIWVDENFDDAPAVAFDAADLDTYAYNGLPTPTPVASVLTETGTIATPWAFNGTRSYQLAVGQGVVVVPPYENQGNGNYQYTQFAVNVGTVPAVPGTVMFRFNWDWLIDATPYSFFVQLVENGGNVDIVAGEDTVGIGSGVIGTLTNTTDWAYITVQVQKNAAASTDSGTGQTLATGTYFYADSATAGYTAPWTVAATADAQTWSFACTDETVYIDDIYWEGGGDADPFMPRALRSFTQTDINSWALY